MRHRDWPEQAEEAEDYPNEGGEIELFALFRYSRLDISRFLHPVLAKPDNSKSSLTKRGYKKNERSLRIPADLLHTLGVVSRRLADGDSTEQCNTCLQRDIETDPAFMEGCADIQYLEKKTG